MILPFFMAATVANANPAYTLENTYPRVMEIVEIDQKEDVAVCVDAVGMEWEFTEPEDLEVGDVVVCTMYDNGTKGTIVDDQIIDVRWSGYVASELMPLFN